MLNHFTSRQERILQSPNYKGGAFKNLSPTPVMAEDASFIRVLKDYFNKPDTVRPPRPVPSVKTELKNLSSDKPAVIWFGHSSYLIHARGVNILVDPVFSGSASPLPNLVKAFEGADIYNAEDFPEIDLLILTHDHYDHFDRKTLRKFRDKTRQYVVPLGVGKYFEKDPVTTQKMTEVDWWESERISDDIKLTATPSRHFSGRGLKRGVTLWTSYVLELFSHKIYLGGDSGYDTHFKAIGDQFGPFDLAILECGQYNASWPHIHMMPEETIQASLDLKAKLLLPVHWGKFVLANHPWNESVIRAVRKAKEKTVEITTPMIGEPVIIGEHSPRKEWYNF